MSRGVEASQWIGVRPLLWLGLGIALAAAPLILYLPVWVPLWTGGMAAWRVWLGWRQRALPSTQTRLFLFIAGVGLVVLTQGTIIGTDAAVAMLLVLVGLKLIELRSFRDFLVSMFVGFFVILSFCFYDTSLGTMLYAFLPSSCLLAGTLQVSAGRRGTMRWGYALTGAWRMMALSLPMTVLLFLFFPRVEGNFIQFGSTSVGVSGFSDRVDPGSLARMTLSRETAFRVEMPGGLPGPADRYWRGIVLLNGEGLSWRRGFQPKVAPILGRMDDPADWQRITLEPHQRKWLFALDRPVRISPYDTMFDTQTFEDSRPVKRVKQYQVASSMRQVKAKLDGEERRAALQLPLNPDPRVVALTEAMRAKVGDNPEALIQAVLAMFAEDFTYTLSPGNYSDEDGLAEFLFERKQGFCEHYAAAFATLMRMVGVPSRLVVGYQGGEVNRHGGYLQVQQRDAHAWTEVWIDGKGWARIDPTAVVAPDRLRYGMARFAEAGGDSRSLDREQLEARQMEGLGWLTDFGRSLGEGWDNLNYQWITWVVEFDRRQQRSFFQSLGTPRGLEWLVMLGGLLVGGAILVAILALALLHKGQRRDPVTRLAHRFCSRLEPWAGKRPGWETLTDYTKRATSALSEEEKSVATRFAQLHARIRYGPKGGHPTELEALLRELSERLARRGKASF